MQYWVIVQFVASPTAIAYSTTCLFKTGREPGIPVQTGQVWVFGAPPNSVEQAQKLGIPLGEPLMFLNSYFIDQEGKSLCIGRQYYIGSRYMFDL